MEKKDKIDLNLDFLGEDALEKSEKRKNDSRPVVHSHKGSQHSNSSKWLMGGGAVVGAIILFSSMATVFAIRSNKNNAEVGNKKDPIVVEDAPVIKPDTPPQPEKIVPKKIVAPVQKSPNQICKDDYGAHSVSNGDKNAQGGPVCDCESGYQWNGTQSTCVIIPVPVRKTNDEFCRDMNGPYGIYNSSDNTCGCASGYFYGAISKQCVSLIESRNQNCAAKYPGTSFLKIDPTDGKNICDCLAGFQWNNEGTACFSLSAFNQSCVNSFGTGSVSVTENGKRVCDCGYGYDWNIQRNACVTTASINALCERDVGRNSRYSGTVSEGKYNCTEPY
jgi:hypothetical protein